MGKLPDVIRSGSIAHFTHIEHNHVQAEHCHHDKSKIDGKKQIFVNHKR